MKTLITGATGFLGAHLVRHLCADGGADGLRVLQRSSAPWLEKLGVEICLGSITDADAVKRAVDGADRIYHLAGFVSRKQKDAHRMYEVHGTGTRILCKAAIEASVKRIVIASTSGTVAVARSADEMPDEDCEAPMEIIARWPYYASKHFQEEIARRVCGDKIEVVTVNPSLLLGPGDDRLSSTRDVLNFLAKEVAVIPGGGVNFVDVRDVAAIMPVAMEKGRPGERYLLGGHNWTLKEFFGRLSRLSKVQRPVIHAKGHWPFYASVIQNALYKAVGRTAAIDPESVEMSEYFWYFPSDKAKNELGFEAREASATLFDTVQYLRQNVLHEA